MVIGMKTTQEIKWLSFRFPSSSYPFVFVLAVGSIFILMKFGDGVID